MKLLKTFFPTIIGSFSSTQTYIRLLTYPFWFSLLSYVFLTLLSAILTLIFLRFYALPTFLTSINTEFNSLHSQLPDTAAFSYKDKKLSFSGISLPFELSSGKFAKSLNLPSVFANFHADNSPKTGALASITPTALFLQSPLSNENSQLAWSELSDTDWTLTKADLLWKWQQFHASLTFSQNYILLLTLPFYWLFTSLSNLILLLFLTVFANSFYWVLGLHLSYLKTFQLGLQALAVGLLLDAFSKLLFPTGTISLVIPAYVGILSLVYTTIHKGLKS